MSYLNNLRIQSWEKAFWFFANMNYTDAQCEFYAKEFEKCAIEEMSGLDGNLTLDDLFSEFVADIMYAEKADVDKERSLHA